MKRHKFYWSLFVQGGSGLLLVGGCGLWLRAQQLQYQIDRQLVAAVIQHEDERAIELVNAGADPNTPCGAPERPSLNRLWNDLFHRPRFRVDKSTAFVAACRGYMPRYDGGYQNIFGPVSPALVETMLRHGANIQGSANDDTPLVCAVAHPEIVRILLRYGADVNAHSRFTSPLEEACLNRSVESIRLLLEQGADVDARHDGGVVLLCQAVGISGDDPTAAKILSLLLAYGADPNAPAVCGYGDGAANHTALEYATHFHRPDLAALLKRAGAKK